MKTLDNVNVAMVKENVPDVKVVGDGDMFQLLCKASSKQEGWMKSCKAMEIPSIGCVVQVTTQQGENVAESITFIPGVYIAPDINGGKKLVDINTRYKWLDEMFGICLNKNHPLHIRETAIVNILSLLGLQAFVQKLSNNRSIIFLDSIKDVIEQIEYQNCVAAVTGNAFWSELMKVPDILVPVTKYESVKLGYLGTIHGVMLLTPSFLEDNIPEAFPYMDALSNGAVLICDQ